MNKPLHVAIVAKDRATVDAFYGRRWRPAAATTARPASARIIIRNYYGAFVLDPDGHNIEAVCHTPP